MFENLQVWFNGKLVPWKSVTIPVLSHGFSRGSAVFEIFGIHVGPEGPAAFRMDEHLKRLMRSIELLEMELPYTMEDIAAAVAETVRTNGLGRGVIKVMAFWGEEAVIKLILDSKLDLAIFPVPATPDLHLDSTEPISACLSKWRKIHPETVPVEAKACSNYLNAYLARKDALNRGFDIGVMAGTDGFLAEASTESVFLVKDGVVKVPPLGRVLNSISRKCVQEMAPVLGIPLREEAVLPNALLDADEIFTAHTGIKVSPVGRFEDRILDAPGPVTARLMEVMEKVLAFEDERFAHWYQPL
ncbi:MAG: aminotransferase class IV [Deltaproteobacteria bacterium]|nr:aminotransferase class IV [Deltaproteobacteria bacterium]